MSDIFLERQNIELRKELSTKQIQWKKERELFQQKLEQMEFKLTEYNEREQRLKSSHGKLMETLTNMNSNNETQKIQNLLEGLTEQVKGLKKAYSKDGSVDGLTTIEKKSTQMDVTPDSYTSNHIIFKNGLCKNNKVGVSPDDKQNISEF